jgi:hypothetical protein
LILPFVAARRFNQKPLRGCVWTHSCLRVKLKRPVRALAPGDELSGQRLQAVDALESSNQDLAVLTDPSRRQHHHSLLEGCATDASALELRIRAVHEVLARTAELMKTTPPFKPSSL